MANSPESSSFRQPVLRPRSGWGVPIALMFVAVWFSVTQPGLLLLVPLALLLIAAPPHRPSLVLLGALLLAAGLVGPTTDVLWWFGRGWALMIGALFLVFTALRPQSSFLDRGLGAVFGSAVGAAGLLAVRSGWTALDLNVAQKLRDTVSEAEVQLGPVLAERNWNPPPWEAMYRFADLKAMIFPALLALASLAALAVTWWVWRRLTVRDANPLSALREFSFRDELVWLVVAAVLLLILPLGQFAERAGTNLAAFIGALYALRGLAVLVALFGAPGPMGVIFGILFFLVLFPIAMASTVVMGLSDTWLDWRSRVPPVPPRPTP